MAKVKVRGLACVRSKFTCTMADYSLVRMVKYWNNNLRHGEGLVTVTRVRRENTRGRDVSLCSKGAWKMIVCSYNVLSQKHILAAVVRCRPQSPIKCMRAWGAGRVAVSASQQSARSGRRLRQTAKLGQSTHELWLIPYPA